MRIISLKKKKRLNRTARYKKDYLWVRQAYAKAAALRPQVGESITAFKLFYSAVKRLEIRFKVL
jgi:uncharacterized membrane protein (DUF2068 family)